MQKQLEVRKLETSQPDLGLSLIRRYALLTLAMVDAAESSALDDFSALLFERDQVLLSLEDLDELSPRAIVEFNIAKDLDNTLQATLKQIQSQTVLELTEVFRSEQGRVSYLSNEATGNQSQRIDRAS